MNYILSQFSATSPEGNLWAAVIKLAKSDLISDNDKLAFTAARYFFKEPADDDCFDIRTFAGVCTAIGINADSAAEEIFRQLEPRYQRRICGLLRDTGYNVRLELTSH